MGEKRPTNETIRIGEIFERSWHTQDTGTSCSFYQVVGKRGKTLVELRRLEKEYYFDEKCNPDWLEIRVRPLSGQFEEDSETVTVRASTPFHSDYGNEPRELHCLSEIGKEKKYWPNYYEFRDDYPYSEDGWHAGNVMGNLKREGKLPPRPGKE